MRRCPQCGSERVHRSRRRGVTEKVIALVSLKIRRCHECNTRLASFGNSVLLLKDLNRFLRKATMLAVMGVAMVLVVAIVVWFSRKEESGSVGLSVNQAVRSQGSGLTKARTA